MNNNVYAIQFRMLEKCNADCSYCDTQHKSNGRLSFNDFCQCVQFIIDDYLPNRGAQKGDYIDIEYSGGEITMYPLLELEQCIDHARKAFQDAGYFVGDSAQSNMVGNGHKVEWLWNKFNGNVSTTFDDFKGNRKLKGSTDRYADKLRINIEDISGKLPDESVFMLDSSSIKGVRESINNALRDGVEVRITPVFNTKDIDVMADPIEMATELNAIMDDWVLNYQKSVEPMNQILRMVAFNDDEMLGRGDACPFVYGCASRSLCIEPNGDLYTCPNQAIAGVNKFGNAIESTCDEKLIRKLSKRGIKLNSKCAECKYRSYCKGGCLNQAMITGDHYDPSVFCEVWFSMFQNAERLIEKHGQNSIKNWLSNI